MLTRAVITSPGAYVVAAGRGVEPKHLHWTRQAALGVAGSATLPHRRLTNEFATLLIAQLRTAGGDVVAWHGERGGHHLLDGIVVPDSYLVLELADGAPLHLLLELDRGTEDHGRLLSKAAGYAKAIPPSPIARHDPLVLLIVASERRARTVGATLADGPWPIAVEHWEPAQSPLSVLNRTMRAQACGP